MSNKRWQLIAKTLPRSARYTQIVAGIFGIIFLLLLLAERKPEWLLLTIGFYIIIFITDECDSTITKKSIGARISRGIRRVIAPFGTAIMIFWSIGMLIEIAKAEPEKISDILSNYAQLALTIAGLTFVGVRFQRSRNEKSTTIEKKLLWCSVAFLVSAICFLYLKVAITLPIFPELAGILHKTLLVTATVLGIMGFIIAILIFLFALLEYIHDIE